MIQDQNALLVHEHFWESKKFLQLITNFMFNKSKLKSPVMYKKTDIIHDSTSSHPSKARKLKYVQNCSLEVDSDFEAINARFFRAYQFQYQVSHNDLERRVSGQTDSD